MTTHPPVRQAAILVGGRGTRLGVLTDTTPKPLLTCGDRPFLAWVLRELMRFGIEDVLLLTGYLGETVEAALPTIRHTLPKPLQITCIREDQPAGTGARCITPRHTWQNGSCCATVIPGWTAISARLFADAAQDSAGHGRPYAVAAAR